MRLRLEISTLETTINNHVAAEGPALANAAALVVTWQ